MEIDDCLSKAGPCWEGYVQRGMKEKDGRMVPNCVPATTKQYDGCGCPECLAQDTTCSECDVCGPNATKQYSGCGCPECEAEDIPCSE